ncbi:MAG: N-acetylmuramoyl-L-alanine amidase [Mariprofundaceae bacterium]|nr:N-acetylmuramoyl-L-alanine amidase [Mariprofundaceae bacterium]
MGDTRIWDAPDHTRIVFDVNGAVKYTIFSLQNPERVVIDFHNTRMSGSRHQTPNKKSFIRNVRYGQRDNGSFRVVLDIKKPMRTVSSLLAASKMKPFRLVVDLWPHKRVAKTASPIPPSGKKQRSRQDRKQGLVIAVDAGHGGEDPGAIGPTGLQEKWVTLKVAKRLAHLINQQAGMRAVLIRKGDYFVPLKKRVALVRRANADLMISLHADSVKEKWVKGSSVYTISERGATGDKVAAALAARENASDLVGGVVLKHQSYGRMTRNVLGDMARQDAFNSSQIMAEQVLHEIKRVGALKYKRPKRARFVVLGALEVPSVLVEMDYISNPSREKKLKSKAYQQAIARALLKATRKFLRRMSLLETPITPSKKEPAS